VADPGFGLARAAIAEGLPVTAAPGASALLAALSVAGLPTDRFWFGGFLPPKQKARRTALSEAAAIPGTLVWFESPKRVHETLSDMVLCLGGDRPAALCRELTKKFEEARRGPLDELATSVADDPPRGEIVLVVGAGTAVAATDDDVAEALGRAMEDGATLRDAVDQVAADTGRIRREVYRLALQKEKDG
jgi:16S rRNA (cytidine1402-2'-O)-methyltransferase